MTPAFSDLEYATRDGRSLVLDLYLPTDSKPTPESDSSRRPGPHPLVLWVHGGAWRTNSKADTGPSLELLDHGYAVASVAYTLSDVATFPAQIEDCKAAVRWLRAHAETYDLDPDRIGAWGESSGGHLVSLLGTTGDGVFDDFGEHREHSSAVQAVCDWFGPTDFLQMSAAGSDSPHDAGDSPESQLVGGPIQDHPARVARANPITYVDGSEPPFLVVHGSEDGVVPKEQSELLASALEEAGSDVTIRLIKGAGHGFDDPTLTEDARAFFDRHLLL